MIRKQSRREWSDKMSDIQNERLIEFISNSKKLLHSQKKQLSLMKTVQMLISVQLMYVCHLVDMRMQLSITKKL